MIIQYFQALSYPLCSRNFPNYFYNLSFPVPGSADRVDVVLLDTVLLCGNTDDFAGAQPEWIALKEQVDASLAMRPQPDKATVQVSSEGFKPTKHHADGRGFPHFYPETHFLTRGDPNQKQGVAGQGFLQVLMRNGKSARDWQLSPPEG